MHTNTIVSDYPTQSNKKRLVAYVLGALVVLLSILLTACTDFVENTQPHPSEDSADETITGHTVGQTFIAQHDGLNGIDVLLGNCENSDTASVSLYLRESPESTADLRAVTTPLECKPTSSLVHFSFEPIKSSTRQRFYILVEAPDLPHSQVSAVVGLAENYQDGSAYLDGQPQAAQMVFSLHYELQWMALGSVITLGKIGLRVLPGALMFWLPGLALMSLLPRSRQLNWRIRWALAPAIGAALYPVILTWCLPLGLRPGALLVWGVNGISAIVLLLPLRHQTPGNLVKKAKQTWSRWRQSQDRNADWVTLVILGIIGAVLFIPIQQFVAPLWDDSVQHAVIAQRIYETGGIFDSWEPYAPYHGMTTHFGFHTAVAAYMWLTGIQVAPAMLIVGQLMQLIGALGLYGLIMYASRNRWAGTSALIIVGLFSLVPAIYTNWGRYPQLTGQAILPASVVFLWATGESKRARGVLAALAGLTSAGTALSYYRTPFLYALFVASWFLFQIVPAWIHKKRIWRRDLFWMGMVVAILVALTTPWVISGLTQYQQFATANRADAKAAISINAKEVRQSPADVDLWEIYQPWLQHPGYRWLFSGALLGILLSLLLCRRRIITIAAWMVGFLVILPSSSFTRNSAFVFSTMIAIYLPATLLIGWLAGVVIRALQHHASPIAQLVLSLAVIAVAGYGSLERLTILDPQFVLVTSADQDAMKWIRQNTPNDAKFLINGIVYTDGTSVVGGDAGWWIPVLAGRANSIPPQYALFTARPNEPGYTQKVYNLVHTLLAHPATTQQGKEAMCAFGITHVYVGQRQGMAVAALPVTIRPDKPMLDASKLAVDSSFKLEYSSDLVRVFSFDQDICSQ